MTIIQAFYSTDYTKTDTEIVKKDALADLNTGSRSTGESARCVRSTTESTRSAGSTTWSTTESTVTTMVKVRKQPPVDSITHTNSRTHFLANKTEMEMKQMGQIQDRCIHNNTFRQMTDPDLHTDLQSNLQADPTTDLQMDLQTDLQVRTDLQLDLWVHRQGLEATLQPNSPMVLFQAETSTGREKSLIWVRNNPSLMLPDHCTSMGRTCEWRRLSLGSRRLLQDPRCVIGELSIKPGCAYRNLQVYKTHHITNTSKELTKCQLAPGEWATQEEQCSIHPFRCL